MTTCTALSCAPTIVGEVERTHIECDAARIAGQTRTHMAKKRKAVKRKTRKAGKKRRR